MWNCHDPLETVARSQPASPDSLSTQAAAAEAEAQVAAEAASREAAAARKRADSEAGTLAELKRKASALEKDAKAAGATIPDLDKPEPKKPAAKKVCSCAVIELKLEATPSPRDAFGATLSK